MSESDDQLLITISEASLILQRSPDTVRRLARTGVLTAQRIPHSHPRLLRSEVETLARAALVPGAISVQLAGSATSPDGNDPSIMETHHMSRQSVTPALHDPVLITDHTGKSHRVLCANVEDVAHALAAGRTASDAPRIRIAPVGLGLASQSTWMLASWLEFSAMPKPGCWSPIGGR